MCETLVDPHMFWHTYLLWTCSDAVDNVETKKEENGGNQPLPVQTLI